MLKGFASGEEVLTEEKVSLNVTANIVIVAAGSLGSTEILLRSKEHGLQLSDQLGKKFSANGDDLVLGVNQDIYVNGNASHKLLKRQKGQKSQIKLDRIVWVIFAIRIKTCQVVLCLLKMVQ